MKQRRSDYRIDAWLLVTFLVLMAVGILMVSSTSMVISDHLYHYPFHYVLRQSIYVVLGLLLLLCVMQVPIERWQQISGYLLVLSMLALILVLIPGIGKSVNGSRRWIHLGFASLQVTEFVKLMAIMYLSSYLVRYQAAVMRGGSAAIKPLIILAIMAILLLLEPDFGTFVVITITFFALLFVAGVPLRLFALLVLVALLGLSAIALFSPYRLARLTTFLHPWAHQFGSGYQLTQSLIAFGRGGLWGVGLGNSVQKLFYLPEAHTDFIFAVLVEELGFVGGLVLLMLYVMLTVRIFKVSMRAFVVDKLYEAYVALGVGCWFCAQVFINVGVSTGVLPTKGLTLPFVSFGGSSLLANCIAIALVLRISCEVEGASPAAGMVHKMLTRRRIKEG